MAGESGPYIVVAHSFGGVYARVFGEGPGSMGDVASYLMLDTYTPDHGMGEDPTLPEDVREDFRADLVTTAQGLATGEVLDWTQVLEDLEVAGPADLPGIRLTIDPASRWSARDPAVIALLMDSWRRSVARVYPGLRHEIAERSGHVIQYDRPDLVIDRTRELVDLARAGMSSP
jgi:pimeloyl-ACP methyl ester carboxylesterase